VLHSEDTAARRRPAIDPSGTGRPAPNRKAVRHFLGAFLATSAGEQHVAKRKRDEDGEEE